MPALVAGILFMWNRRRLVPLRQVEAGHHLAGGGRLVDAALEAPRLLIGKLLGQLVGIRIGARIDVTDVAHTAGTEPCHHQHTAGGVAFVVLKLDTPAQDRREGARLAARWRLDPPLDGAFVRAIEAREGFARGGLAFGITAEADMHALVASAQADGNAIMART